MLKSKKRNKKIMFTELNNKSNEVAFVYKLGEKEFDLANVGISKGTEHEVEPFSSTTAFHLLKTSKECVLVCLHNHPSGSIISLSDIMFLLLYDNVKMIIAVTNLGSISYVVKNKKYNKEKASKLYSEAVKLSNKSKNIKEMQDAVKHFIKSCKNVGIIYQVN